MAGLQGFTLVFLPKYPFEQSLPYKNEMQSKSKHPRHLWSALPQIRRVSKARRKIAGMHIPLHNNDIFENKSQTKKESNIPGTHTSHHSKKKQTKTLATFFLALQDTGLFCSSCLALQSWVHFDFATAFLGGDQAAFCWWFWDFPKISLIGKLSFPKEFLLFKTKELKHQAKQMSFFFGGGSTSKYFKIPLS